MRVPRGGAAITPLDPAQGGGPDPAERLTLRIGRLTFRRLGRARLALGALRGNAAAPVGRDVIDALAEALRVLPPETRARILTGPDLRGFLSEAETWIAIRRLAAGGLAWRGRAGGPAGDRRRARLQARLFDHVSRTRDLVALVPRGRIDPAFPARCLRLARRRLDDAIVDLAALVLGLRLLQPRPGVTGVMLRFREDAEQGRPGDRIDLGTIAGPAGPLAIAFMANRGAARARRSPLRVRAELRGATLALRGAGARVVVLPAAGTRLIVPDLERGRPSPGPRGRGASFRLVRRDMIPGTSIVLAPVVESRPSRLRVTREAGGLGRRLARALRIVRIAWPEAFHEIERRTHMVAPIREPGTVSYSMAARPGISYINVFGKSLVDLADDLLHETAHHRLHDQEETAALLVPGPETLEAQAFDSPWRGARRPLRGILHGVYTFLFRAELFRRVLQVARRHPRTLASELGPTGRAFVLRELRRERRMIAAALRDLEEAARSGLLTRAGRQLLREMRAWSARLDRRYPLRSSPAIRS